MKIKASTLNWGHRTFVVVSDQLHDLPKIVKDGGKIGDIFLDGLHENSGIVNIQGGTKSCSVCPDRLEFALGRGLLKDVVQGVNGENKE